MAKRHERTVVTDNERDFAGLRVINPMRTGLEARARCMDTGRVKGILQTVVWASMAPAVV